MFSQILFRQGSLIGILATTIAIGTLTHVADAQVTPRSKGEQPSVPTRQSDAPTRGGDRSPDRPSEPPVTPQRERSNDAPTTPARSPSDVGAGGKDPRRDSSPIPIPKGAPTPQRENRDNRDRPDTTPKQNGSETSPRRESRPSPQPDRSPGTGTHNRDGSNRPETNPKREDRPLSSDKADQRAPNSGPVPRQKNGISDTDRFGSDPRNSASGDPSSPGRTPQQTSRVDQDTDRKAPRFTIADRPSATRTPDRWISPDYRERRWTETLGARQFTWSRAGCQYNNGLSLRPAIIIAEPFYSPWFQDHVVFYPHYYAGSVFSSHVVFNPWSNYIGCAPPYIYQNSVYIRQPRVIYVDAPVYVDGSFRSYDYGNDTNEYYLSRQRTSRWWRDDFALSKAVYAVQDAFLTEDISLLSTVIQPDTDVAVFSKGKYEYSVRPNDYLDLTRDFMRTARTTDFEILNVKTKGSGAVNVSVRHVYRNPKGDINVSILTIVLERLRGEWSLTQVDSVPERL